MLIGNFTAASNRATISDGMAVSTVNTGRLR